MSTLRGDQHTGFLFWVVYLYNSQLAKNGTQNLRFFASKVYIYLDLPPGPFLGLLAKGPKSKSLKTVLAS